MTRRGQAFAKPAVHAVAASQLSRGMKQQNTHHTSTRQLPSSHDGINQCAAPAANEKAPEQQLNEVCCCMIRGQEG